jgi:hypothetical protein
MSGLLNDCGRSTGGPAPARRQTGARGGEFSSVDFEWELMRSSQNDGCSRCWWWGGGYQVTARAPVSGAVDFRQGR